MSVVKKVASYFYQAGKSLVDHTLPHFCENTKMDSPQGRKLIAGTGAGLGGFLALSGAGTLANMAIGLVTVATSAPAVLPGILLTTAFYGTLTAVSTLFGAGLAAAGSRNLGYPLEDKVKGLFRNAERKLRPDTPAPKQKSGFDVKKSAEHSFNNKAGNDNKAPKADKGMMVKKPTAKNGHKPK